MAGLAPSTTITCHILVPSHLFHWDHQASLLLGPGVKVEDGRLRVVLAPGRGRGVGSHLSALSTEGRVVTNSSKDSTSQPDTISTSITTIPATSFSPIYWEQGLVDSKDKWLHLATN